MTPDKIEIPIPAYFKRDRTEAIAYWDNLLKVTMLLLLLLLLFTAAVVVVVVVVIVVVFCCCCCCCCHAGVEEALFRGQNVGVVE